mmetsp:Transcript_105852/g.184078  ORF Transcript_105852/g.184078 Transcript_105852/m.184078 type:complete len:378 (-) Transcript_105852:33-1166(-)
MADIRELLRQHAEREKGNAMAAAVRTRQALQEASEACDSAGADFAADVAKMLDDINRAENNRDLSALASLKMKCDKLATAVRDGRAGRLQLELAGVVIVARWETTVDSEGQESVFTFEIGDASAVYSHTTSTDYGYMEDSRTFMLQRGDRSELLFYSCSGELKKVAESEGQIAAFFPELLRLTGIGLSPAQLIGEFNCHLRRVDHWIPFKQLWFTYTAAREEVTDAGDATASAFLRPSQLSSSEAPAADAAASSTLPEAAAGPATGVGSSLAPSTTVHRAMARVSATATSMRDWSIRWMHGVGRRSSSAAPAVIHIEEACPVCLELFDAEDASDPKVIAMTLTCGHQVCKECWRLWAAAAPNRAQCPLCRSGEPQRA